MFKSARDKLIEDGLIVPAERQFAWNERPLLSYEAIQKLKAKLIRAGLLFPGGRGGMNGVRH